MLSPDIRNTANRRNTGPVPWADATVKSAVIASDNVYMNYPLEYYNDYYYGENGYPQRDRWLEISWTGFASNTPPSTNPVSISNPADLTPTISWTYFDAEDEPQVEYEVEVWTGAGGTGANVWDPAVGTGTDSSVVYAGAALVPGDTYYARVKAFDGTNWGGWSETSWTVPMVLEKINIDIYPNRVPNQVFLSRNYTLYVAVQGSATFDVTTLNSSTVKFGKTGAEASPIRTPLLRDLNWDGFNDAMYGFRTFDCGFTLGDTEGWLKGTTVSGTPIEGSDSVVVSP